MDEMHLGACSDSFPFVAYGEERERAYVRVLAWSLGRATGFVSALLQDIAQFYTTTCPQKKKEEIKKENYMLHCNLVCILFSFHCWNTRKRFSVLVQGVGGRTIIEDWKRTEILPRGFLRLSERSQSAPSAKEANKQKVDTSLKRAWRGDYPNIPLGCRGREWGVGAGGRETTTTTTRATYATSW